MILEGFDVEVRSDASLFLHELMEEATRLNIHWADSAVELPPSA